MSIRVAAEPASLPARPSASLPGSLQNSGFCCPLTAATAAAAAPAAGHHGSPAQRRCLCPLRCRRRSLHRCSAAQLRKGRGRQSVGREESKLRGDDHPQGQRAL
jgi:hypothetical protein